MITKEAIEAAARAMCEAWHYSKIGMPDGDAEWARKQDQYRTQARAALTAALAVMPGPAVKDGVFEFDRYINGRLMAEGVTIERETTFEAAAASAARIASRGPNGEAPVLVMRTPTPDLASENERLRAALTPSGNTKAAYIGEFSFKVDDRDEDGEECSREVAVPWTTIKEIMSAIREHAALERRT